MGNFDKENFDKEILTILKWIMRAFKFNLNLRKNQCCLLTLQLYVGPMKCPMVDLGILVPSSFANN